MKAEYTPNGGLPDTGFLITRFCQPETGGIFGRLELAGKTKDCTFSDVIIGSEEHVFLIFRVGSTGYETSARLSKTSINDNVLTFQSLEGQDGKFTRLPEVTQ